ncbi:hypothetical protein GGR07_002101 [Bacteroides pyogenes]|nr:hypothetical protein [Bacteroides pyogenes]
MLSLLAVLKEELCPIKMKPLTHPPKSLSRWQETVI